MKFLSSIYWQEFQQKYGRKVSRINDLNIIYHPLRFGLCWGFVPSIEKKDLDQLDKIIKDAQENRAIYLKLEPYNELDWSGINKYKPNPSQNIHPLQSLILDLGQEEVKLLEKMKPKTRYNIRLAEKKGVKIEKNPNQSVNEFYKLIKETEIRDRAKFHSQKYYDELGLIII